MLPLLLLPLLPLLPLLLLIKLRALTAAPTCMGGNGSSRLHSNFSAREGKVVERAKSVKVVGFPTPPSNAPPEADAEITPWTRKRTVQVNTEAICPRRAGQIRNHPRAARPCSI